MEYRRLGKAGIQVSALSFGSWLTFGKNLDITGARDCIHFAFDNGVNFFDNAEVYGKGVAELLMGEIVRELPRDEYVISTKIMFGTKDVPNCKGLSWKHLVEGTNASLRRLGLEYVDLLFCHRPDPDTPIEETVRAMDHIIRQGKAFYWGTSEWTADQLKEAYRLADKFGCVAPTMEQPEYSMLKRAKFEKELGPICDKFGLGTTIWSPLASGILTGKYQNGVPEGSRLAENDWLRERLSTQLIETVGDLGQIAGALDMSLTQMALAWCLKNPRVSTVILGASSTEQLRENLSTLDALPKLDDDVMRKIGDILKKGASLD